MSCLLPGPSLSDPDPESADSSSTEAAGEAAAFRLAPRPLPRWGLPPRLPPLGEPPPADSKGTAPLPLPRPLLDALARPLPRDPLRKTFAPAEFRGFVTLAGCSVRCQQHPSQALVIRAIPTITCQQTPDRSMYDCIRWLSTQGQIYLNSKHYKCSKCIIDIEVPATSRGMGPLLCRQTALQVLGSLGEVQVFIIHACQHACAVCQCQLCLSRTCLTNYGKQSAILVKNHLRKET